MDGMAWHGSPWSSLLPFLLPHPLLSLSLSLPLPPSLSPSTPAPCPPSFGQKGGGGAWGCVGGHGVLC